MGTIGRGSPPGGFPTWGSCHRCGEYGRVLSIGDHSFCGRCAELGLNYRPDYRKEDRRSPLHEKRGFGRRFSDILRPR